MIARRTRAVAGMALLALVAFPVVHAAAHAVLVAADPQPGAALRTPPTSVHVEFSEPLDAALSGIDVYASSGHRVPSVSGGVEPGNPRGYEIRLEPLRPDRYAVVWHTVSDVDGHSRRGSYTFTVDRPDGSAPRIAHAAPPAGAAPGQVPTAGQAGATWFALAGLFLLAGAVLVRLLARGTGLLDIAAVRRWLWWSVIGGVAGLVAGTAGELVSAWAPAGWSRASLGAVLTSSAGRWEELRVVAAAAVLAGWKRTWPAPVCVAVATYTFAATGHVAAASPGIGLAFEFAHVLAVSSWLGGAVAVAAVWAAARRAGTGDRRTMLRRYSVTAGTAVPVVIASGLGNALLEVGRTGDLVTSSYGRTLLVKLAVVAVLLAVAAVNAALLRPALEAGRPGGRRLDRTIAIEAALGLAVLVPTALLAVLAPTASTITEAPSLTRWLEVIALIGAAAALGAASRGIPARKLKSAARAVAAGGIAAGIAWAATAGVGAPTEPVSATAWGAAHTVVPETAAGAQIWRLAAGAGPMIPALAPDGSVWIAEMNLNRLARLDPRSDVVQEFDFPGGYRETMDVVVAPNGEVWLAQERAKALGVFDPAIGRYREVPIPGAAAAPVGLALGPDRAVWFTDMSGNRIGRFDPSTARFTSYPVPTPDAAPYGIAVGPHGRVWFAEFAAGKVGVLDPRTGRIREYAIPGHPNVPALAVARDGAVWLTTLHGTLYRLVPSGDLHAIALPAGGDYGVAVAPDGAVWVGCDGGRALFAVQPDTGQVRRHLLPAGSAPWWPAVDSRGDVWAALAGAGRAGLAELKD